MKPIALIPALLTFVLTISACGNRTAPTPAETSAAVDPGLTLLVVAEGEVLLKRDGWSNYHPTAFGAAVYRGDQLRPAAGAKVVVLCDNLTAWTVPPGAPSGLTSGCPQPPEPALVHGESAIGDTRGGTDPLIPFIISPRATKLLNPTPTLRWNPVPGAKSYTVRLSGVNWQDTVSATEVIYPGDPPLQPGMTYLLIVEADNGKSSKEEGVAGLGFSLLPDEEARHVRADAAKIAGLNLTDEAKAFALAQLYAGRGLYTEAIERLDKMAEAGIQAANIYRALGDLYRRIGLSLLAETRYSEAVTLAETARDIEALAAAQAGLGDVYAALGNKDEAVRWLKQAQAGYDALGDSQRASGVSERLAEMSK
jgi:hypothetical protein